MRIFVYVCIMFTLTACVAPKPVVHNGVQAFEIRTVAMGRQPLPLTEEYSKASERAALIEIREGTKISRLKPQAKKVCPNGFNILSETKVIMRPYLIQASHEFYPRYTKNFVISCK